MAPMSINARITRGDYGDSTKLTKWILDSGATCHMEPEILEDNYKEVADGTFVTEKNRRSSNKNAWQ